MFRKKKASSNIKQFKRKREINVGLVLFAVVLIYLLVTLFIYLTSKHVSIYEVREGSILKDHSYTGLILREEETVNTETEGYINYFVSEGSKARKGCSVYTLSEKKLNADTVLQSEDVELSSRQQSEILTNMQNFCDNYKEADFSEVYTLKENISSILLSSGDQTMTAQLDTFLEENKDESIQIGSAQRDGIVMFSTDGYENVSWDNFKASDLVKADLQTVVHNNGYLLSSGDVAYKLITSENWSVVIELDNETAKNLKDEKTSTIKTKIAKDGQSLWANLELKKLGGKYYACLTYKNSVIRYASDRFLDVELIMEDQSGLKIPKTAVIKKKYYKIPADYMTLGGNSSSAGVMVQKDDEMEFQSAGSVYYSSDDAYAYLDASLFKKNTILVNPDSMETCPLEDTTKLKGVYSVNKGYAVFRRIKILCKSDEYYIVDEETSGGLSNYDHIVLDGSTVKENEIIFQ